MNVNNPACKLAAAGFTVLLTLFACSGCSSMNAKQEKSLLSAAGFHVVTPSTTKQKEFYAAAQPYKVLRGDKDGHVIYAYKDEKDGVAYVGGEQEYQRYQQLLVQQRISDNAYMAAQMNQNASFGWYGAYGPYVGRPYRVGVRRF